MLEEVKYCKKVTKYKFNKPLKTTEEDEINFQKADECHICNKKYTDQEIRVRDHCHVTGQYSGSAHQDRCFLNEGKGKTKGQGKGRIRIQKVS